MVYTYQPRGTCSRRMRVEIENGVIRSVEIVGGCSGNLQGITKLIEGQKAADVIGKLRGIRCGFKPTSCPDQLAVALQRALEKEAAG